MKEDAHEIQMCPTCPQDQDKAGLGSALQRVGVTPCMSSVVCRAVPIPELGVCDTLRHQGTGEGSAGSAAPGCRQRHEQAWREQGHTPKHRESCISSSPCGWDGPGDKHIVTRSPINPSRLCLHNRECFSCFMEVDRNSTGTKGPGPG